MALIEFPRIAITYDSAKNYDGFGAQAIRILGIYSIAERLKMDYLSNRIYRIDAGEEFVKSEDCYDTELSTLNDWLELPTAAHICNKYREITVWNLSRKKLFQYFFLNYLPGGHLHLKVSLPFGILDRHPRLWSQNTGRILSKRLHPSSEIYDVVIHLRTGFEHFSHRRQLPGKYFRDTLNQYLKNATLRGHKVKMKLHTDLELGMEKTQDGFEKERLDYFLLLRQLSNDYDCEIGYKEPLITFLNDASKAKCFIMSRSALSFLGGILNSHTVIYPPSHGHTKQAHWIDGSSIT
jgi:hypothetical protein